MTGKVQGVTGPTFRRTPVRVRVPATSANLGPGFDAVALALTRYDQVEAQVVAGRPGEPSVLVETEGEGAGELPTDEKHLVAQVMLATFDQLGGRPPGLLVRCVNEIPQARGMGSSAAAIVAGVLAARALVADSDVDPDRVLDQAAVLRLAASVEGHPDNVAACLLGGLAVAWVDETGARAVRIEPAPGVRPVLFVPDLRGFTPQARALLPERVPHPDAAMTAGRAALLVYALTRDPGVLLAATEDRLHQPYRAAAAPRSAALIRHLRSAGVPAVLSGAGPTVLAFAGRRTDLSGFGGDGFVAYDTAPDRVGARILE